MSKRRKNEDWELASLMESQRKLTERWYRRISGSIPWMPGERQAIDAKTDELSERIWKRIKELGLDREADAEWFANLPAE